MIHVESIEAQLSAIKGAPVTVRIPSSTGHSFVVTCPNPSHTDHNPSCVGDLETGKYKCLECGFSGELDF